MISTSTEIVVDGNRVPVNYIDCGCHAKVYRAVEDPNTVYSVIKKCPVRRLLVGIDHPHIPKITRHDPIEDGQVFSMPYYNPLNRTGSQYRIYRAISNAYDNAKSEVFELRQTRIERQCGMEVVERTIEIVQEGKLVPTSVIEALYILYDKMQPIGSSASFDIHTGNFAEDAKGNIIFLDVACDANSFW